MRPDVALAFDRMEAAARADGVTLLIASAFRVPAIAETQAYVADILGLLHGAGDAHGAPAGALQVRLVR